MPSRSLISLGVAATLLIAILIAFAGSKLQGDEASSDTSGQLPPPPGWVMWNIGGQFRLPIYDDRELPDVVKRAYPIIDPRWEPFAVCMEEHGEELRSTPGAPVGYEAIEQLLARLEVKYPPAEAREATLAGNYDYFEGGGQAYLECAGQWLALPEEEWAQHGLERPAFPDMPTLTPELMATLTEKYGDSRLP